MNIFIHNIYKHINLFDKVNNIYMDVSMTLFEVKKKILLYRHAIKFPSLNTIPS